MTRIILLDCGPLGALVHPSRTGDSGLAKTWYRDLTKAGFQVKVPQIADYELRRKLIREKFATSIAELNRLIRETAGIVPITPKTMNKAAELWADARSTGKASCDDTALDADMILCAQAFLLGGSRREVIIATTNVKHLEHYSTCSLWSTIKAS